MRVYAESNFVLEMVLEQEGCAACEELISLARSDTITLGIPAVGIAEPFSTLQRRRIEREKLKTAIDGQLREIGRTLSLAASVASNDLAALLAQSAQQAEERYREVRSTLVAAADLLPLTSETFEEAERLSRAHGLVLPDSLVLASVLLDPAIGTEPTCFINRNTKDFDDPPIVTLLRERSCKLFGNFTSGLAYVRAQIDAQ